MPRWAYLSRYVNIGVNDIKSVDYTCLFDISFEDIIKKMMDLAEYKESVYMQYVVTYCIGAQDSDTIITMVFAYREYFLRILPQV